MKHESIVTLELVKLLVADAIERLDWVCKEEQMSKLSDLSIASLKLCKVAELVKDAIADADESEEVA